MRSLCSRLILVLIFFAATAFAHDRKNVDNISVLFGGEPEPMVNDERQFLRWIWKPWRPSLHLQARKPGHIPRGARVAIPVSIRPATFSQCLAKEK